LVGVSPVSTHNASRRHQQLSVAVTATMKENQVSEEQVKFLQDYEAWKIEEKLVRQYNDTPTDYLKYLRNINNQTIIDNAIQFIEKYEKGSPWSKELIEDLASILRDEKK
jgi:uncharacterized protein YqeY